MRFQYFCLFNHRNWPESALFCQNMRELWNHIYQKYVKLSSLCSTRIVDSRDLNFSKTSLSKFCGHGSLTSSDIKLRISLSRYMSKTNQVYVQITFHKMLLFSNELLNSALSPKNFWSVDIYFRGYHLDIQTFFISI